MMRRTIYSLLTPALCLLLLPAAARAQGEAWDKYNRAGEAAAVKGDYGEAERNYLAAVAEAEKHGPKNPYLAHSLSELGRVKYEQGKYAEAEPLYKRAIAIDEEVSKDASLAVVLNNLAELYRTQARYAEAEPLLKRAISVFEKSLGPNHPNVGVALENYAVVLRGLNRNAEAAAAEARARAIQGK
ncbi:MAG TPA: tetratricopeptide repeat protein [Pyrinomonadaceae bacterium]